MLEISTKDIELETTPFAKGRFGKVYKATWRKLKVAVKVIDVEKEKDRKAVEQEASITFRLSHSNVVELFGITRLKRTKPGIVMEWAEHGSLNMWIGNIDLEKQTNIALGIVSGLMYVHSQKVIHRDIKPQNILTVSYTHLTLPTKRIV